jgi:2-dehydropantoate 2-reductase
LNTEVGGDEFIMPRIALIGPGAIGGLVAAWLCQDDRNHVTVCARTPIQSLQLETSDGVIEARPTVLTQPEQGHTADWVLVATKAYDSASAAAWFSGLLDEDTRVAVLQNGVDHVERFSEFLPAERIVPVVVDCPTERVEPERIRQRGPATLVVPESAIGSAFAELFARTQIDATTDKEFVTVAWRKLCINAAGAVNALTLEPARIAHEPHAEMVMRKLVLEAVAVGRVEGAKLDDSIADEVITMYQNQPGDSINSLLADRLAARPMEIDLRNGVIVRLGRRHGISTPFNEMAVALLKSVAPKLEDSHV